MRERSSLRPLHALDLAPLLLTLAVVTASSRSAAADWPQWRCDSARRGESPEEIPETLHLQWLLELPLPDPAWPSNQEKLQFDRLYEPVLASKRLFVPSMAADKVSAYDSDSGRELWSFYAEGPVRLAPAVWDEKLYFASDDGHLYCLDAASGTPRWKFRGAPSSLKVFGNDRLASAWPARGAPVVHEGKVYFAAGIWPFMGTYIHCLDASSGAVVWTNGGTGSNYTVQQHSSPAFAGVAPQGYLAVAGDRLVVAGGRTVPAVFDLKTGELLHFNVSSRAMGSRGGGGYEVVCGKNFVLNKGSVYRLDNGSFVASADALVVSDNAVIGRDGEGLLAYKPALEFEETKDRRGWTTKKAVLRKAWTAPLSDKVQRVFLKSGSRLYASGEKGRILAIDLPRLDSGARVSWKVDLPDAPLSMLAGDGKLFVASDEGRIYSFGGRPADAKLPSSLPVTLVPRGAAWRYHDQGNDLGEDWRAAEFDDAAWPSGPAVLGYGDRRPATKLEFGADPKKKPVTSYFRHSFDVTASESYGRFSLKALVDDGAVFYLNGVEVARLRIPTGDVRSDTLAEANSKEGEYAEVPLANPALRPGTNVLAVEVHQASRESSDLSFDLELAAVRLRGARVPAPERDRWNDVAREVVERSGARKGWALVLGLGTGRLAEALAAESELHVVVLDPDAERVDAFRRRLDRLGLYGTRVAAIAGGFEDAELPPYFAELVTSEAPLGDVLGGVFAETDLAAGRALAALFRCLRPFSGVACFAAGDAEYGVFAQSADAARLDQGRIERTGRFALLRRCGAPSGSADWTHQNGDASNNVASADSVVKLPLGLLWFGGPSHEGILPRHGHGPTPQVAGGRLVIEGRHLLRAVDVYTGRLLWERSFRDLGKDYDYESHEPGANILGSNYVTLRDAVYVAHETTCHKLDPADGRTVAEFSLPPGPDGKTTPDWGYLGVWGDVLVAGARPSEFATPDFSTHEAKAFTADQIKDVLAAVKTWRGFEAPPREKDQDDRTYVQVCLNKLLLDPEFLDRVPLRVRYKADAEALEGELDKYLAAAGHKPSDHDAVVLKRKLLNRYYKLPEYQKRAAGKFASHLGAGSRALVGLDRHSGRILWQRPARHEVRHNAVALGGGKVYLIDRLSDEERNFLRRRGLVASDSASLSALDIQSGDVLWSTSKRAFGTWLGYSEAHDVLIQAGSQARDRASDEATQGMAAYRGSSGEVLWEHDEKYSGPPVILGRDVITQAQSSPGFALDLLSGRRKKRRHPLSGEEVEWKYTRNYGCNTALGAPHLLTFRSAAAGFFDLAGDGTGNFGGFRSGCTSNLIPAGGVLSAPDYTRACTCSYQNQTSLALVHMPELEFWTFSPYRNDYRPVRRVGLNFGAPGDRRAPDGTLWLDVPSSGGVSPDPAVDLRGEKRRYLRQHSDQIEAGALRWVGASAVEGASEVSVRLLPVNDLVVPNEVQGGAALHAENFSLESAVPVDALPAGGARNGKSLQRGRGSGKTEAYLGAHEALAPSSITVEFWTRVDGDVDYVDARSAAVSGDHAFVIDNLTPRVRYAVADADGNGPEPLVTLQAKEKLPAGVWTHLAFTYDSASGVGKLYRDGKVADENDGPDSRALWWKKAAPEYGLLRNPSGKESLLDELRVAKTALGPADFLNSKDSKPAADSIVGHWRMEALEASGGGGLRPRLYTVRLVFAEIGGRGPGERVFDVGLQGRTCIESLDVSREAGGPFRTLVKEFRDVSVNDFLRVTLAPRKGETLLGGLQAVVQTREF